MRNEDYLEQREIELQERLPVVLTAREAMEILGVGKNTIYRLLNSGTLKAIRIGRSWKIDLNSLLSLLK
mgnify:CR=1 FL=1